MCLFVGGCVARGVRGGFIVYLAQVLGEFGQWHGVPQKDHGLKITTAYKKGVVRFRFVVFFGSS